jgi:hypothetical protein
MATLQDFLINLGFQVNNASLRTFQVAVAGAGAAAQKLGAVATAAVKLLEGSAKRIAITFGLTAGGLTLVVQRMVRDFEELYYAVQRAGSSAESLLALRYAASQIGLGFGGLEGQAQSLMRTLRRQPWVEGWLNQMGIATRTLRGGLLDSAQILNNIARWYQMMIRRPGGEPIAASILEQWGLDPDTIRQAAVNLEELIKAQEDYRKKLAAAGLDSDKVSRQAVNIMRAIRSVFATVEVTFQRVVSALFPDLITALRQFDAWLTAIAPDITKYLVDTVKEFIAWIKRIDWKAVKQGFIDIKDWIVENWPAARKEIVEFANDVMLIVRALAEVLRVAKEVKNWFEEHSPETAPPPDWGPDSPDKRSGPRMLWDWLKKKFGDGEEGSAEIPPLTPNIPAPGSRAGPRGDTARAAQGYFEGQGWTSAQAAGIVANLWAESGLNPRAGVGTEHVGAAQWDATRQKDFAKLFHHSIQDATLGEQLAFVQYELTRGKYAAVGNALRQQQSAGSAAGIVSEGYEIPAKPGSPEAQRYASERAAIAKHFFDAVRTAGRTAQNTQWSAPLHAQYASSSADRNVQIAQTNNITVTGSDAHDTHRAVVDGLVRVNGDMVRNLRPILV